MDSCHGNPSPSDPMESVCRHFRPRPQLYFAVYLLSLSQTDLRQSNGRLPLQPVATRLPTFSTPSSTILCCIFTKSLANWLPVSLVAYGLCPSDSVRVYWTTLFNVDHVTSAWILAGVAHSHFTLTWYVSCKWKLIKMYFSHYTKSPPMCLPFLRNPVSKSNHT